MSKQIRVLLFTVCASAAALAILGAQDGSVTVTVKGSTAFAAPTPVAIKSALLVVTPSWDDVEAKTQVGGREASGQPLALADLAVVLSTQALDCATVFKRAPSTTETDVTIVAGKAEAFLPAKGWQTTTVGKVFMAAEMAAVHLVLDRFSADVHTAALKKKTVSKDGLRGNDGRLVLDQEAGKWRVDVMARIEDAVIEGKASLTSCPIASRTKSAAGAPLLAERRLLDAARNF
jgi:hypothetical protein